MLLFAMFLGFFHKLWNFCGSLGFSLDQNGAKVEVWEVEVFWHESLLLQNTNNIYTYDNYCYHVCVEKLFTSDIIET